VWREYNKFPKGEFRTRGGNTTSQFALGDCPLNVEIGGQALPGLCRQARGVDTAKEIKAMTNTIALSSIALARSLAAAWQIVARFWRLDAKFAGTWRAILQSEGPDF
jgi:hypothetical protein